MNHKWKKVAGRSDMGNEGREIELKLGMDPAALERLKRHPLVKDSKCGRPTLLTLTSVYYDTPGLDLSRAGITVRVRSSNHRHVQTVKTAGDRASGLFSRREWEEPVADAAPHPALLTATGLPQLADDGIVSALRPLFATEVRRTRYLLRGDEWEVELALDRGEIRAGAATEPLCEAELELRRGTASDLFRIAGAFTAAVPARLLALSKSDRGHRLAAGARPLPCRAGAVPVTAEMDVAEGFQAIARGCLHQLLMNEEPLVAARDPEAVHQMRVALRRLRSAIRMFRSVVAGAELSALRDDMRWLLDQLGPARDGEVFLGDILEPALRAMPGRPGLDTLVDDCRARRDGQMDMAVAAVTDGRFTHLLLALGAWVEGGDWLARAREQPLPERLPSHAGSVLRKWDKRMRKAGRGRLAAMEPEALHQLRILGKQLRYGCEFMKPLYPRKSLKPFLDALGEVQEVLGWINDVEVASARLAGERTDLDRAFAAGLVAGWHEARRPGLLEAAERACRRYRRQRRPWEG